MDNQAMRDDTKQSNSTHPNSKVLVRMESVVSSVTSTQELVEANSATSFNANAKAGKIRAMISNRSRKMLFAVICLLSVGIVTMTSLFLLEYHKKKESVVTKETSLVSCLEFTPDIVLNEMPNELRSMLPAIESKITSTAQQSGFKALSYGIAYNGKLWWTFHYGRKNFTNPSSPQPNNDTPYPAASLSKLFTAVMLLKLIEIGTIKSVDDPIDKYDPDFKVQNPFNSERISFRQLLCMTSGLPREAPCYPPKDFNFCPYNTTEMWRRLSNVSLELRPNMATVYSNLGFAILGRVMGKIMNGTNYEDWMKKEIFDRLGLQNTGFNIRQKYNSIPVSQDADKKISRIIDWGWLRPAGGIYTSLNDLHKFVNILLERLNTTVLKMSSKRMMFRNEFQRPLGCPATVWQLKTGETTIDMSRKKEHKQKFYIANGLTVGYTSQIRLSPQNTLATYGLCADGSNYMGFLRLDHHIGNIVFSSVAQALKKREEKYQAPSNMDAYVGSYRLTSYWPLIKQNLVIRIKDGRLNMMLEWFSADLSYIRPWTLKTVHSLNSMYCKDANLANGLLNNVYFFQSPADGESKCPGLYVRSISAFGYASFVRV